MTGSRSLASVVAGLVVIVGCGDSSAPTPGDVGTPAELTLVSTNLSAPANTDLTGIQIVVKDAQGHGLPDQTVTFSVTAGGGAIASPSATSEANGVVTVPPWRLGKSDVPQQLMASINAITKAIDATIATSYDIDIRFFGNPMTAAQQALYMNAAARLSAAVTGDIEDGLAQNVDIRPCGVNAVLNETIDDVIVYASIDTIDGPGKTLAVTVACLFRDPAPGQALGPAALGVVKFDKDDISRLSPQNQQDVVLHEVLHVIGIGSVWNYVGLLQNPCDGANPCPWDPRYTGAQGRLGCAGVGGSAVCASSVPVENLHGAGTADAHWRESVFGNELMTGFINAAGNPLSSMTIVSLRDLGYTVNAAVADSYSMSGSGFSIAGAPSSTALLSNPSWERIEHDTILVLDASGRARRVKLQ